jgi:hypothetical protein
MNEVG